MLTLHHLYSQLPDGDGVAEAPEPFPLDIPEKLVSCLWFDPRWRPSELGTLDGRRFTVLSPGQWNRQAGPDFHQAVIVYADGERCRGDVEIHRLASGWVAHRHHLDERYNRVILHVVLRHDRMATEVTRADGQAVPQVALEAWLPRPLSTYRAEIPLEDYPRKHAPRIGHCYTLLRTLEPTDVQHFLERAGETRLQQRMDRWAHRAAEVGLAQVMYEAVLRSLGAAGYRQRFQELARLVSWQEAQRCLLAVPIVARTVAAEALLLGLAGILPQAVASATPMDDETQDYIAKLCHHWERFPRDVRQRAQTQVSWRQPHVRPANTAERRLAGMAQLLARHHGMDLLQAGTAICGGHTDVSTARTLCKHLTALCDTPELSYWSRRTHFGGRLGKVQRLIGNQRALTVVIDAVVPLLLLAAQQRGDTELRHALLACYRAAPRLPDNAVLRDMARRLLGDDPALLALIRSARHQQGVLQVFDDFCSNDEGECQGCGFPTLINLE